MKKLNTFKSSLDYYKKFSRDSSSRVNAINENNSFFADMTGLVNFIRFIVTIRKSKKININFLSGGSKSNYFDLCKSSSDFDLELANIYISTTSERENTQEECFVTYSSIYFLVYLVLPFFLIVSLFNVFGNYKFSKEYGFINSIKRYAIFLSKNFVYGSLYKICNSKTVHLVDSYSTNQAANYSAKQQQITTIEIQHGIVSKGHLGYNRTNLNVNFYPCKILLLSDVFIKHLDILKLPNINYEVTTLNYFSRLKLMNTDEMDLWIVIGQPSISNELTLLYKQLAGLGLNIKYKAHPREAQQSACDVNYYTNNFFIKNCTYIGGFSTLLLELVASGCGNVIALTDFVPKFYDEVLKDFGLKLDDLDSITKKLNDEKNEL